MAIGKEIIAVTSYKVGDKIFLTKKEAEKWLEDTKYLEVLDHVCVTSSNDITNLLQTLINCDLVHVNDIRTLIEKIEEIYGE